jgi:hypothetical protein
MKEIVYLHACKMMARVSVPFTDGHYYGREERPNTELAHNSLSAGRQTLKFKV